MHEEKVKLFLKELSELTLKYGIEIDGCGCCGSPWINEISESVQSGRYSVILDEDKWEGSEMLDQLTWKGEKL